MEYLKLSQETERKIEQDRECHRINPYRFDDRKSIRRKDEEKDRASILRPVFVRDIEKILNFPLYNRYSDKTQVFSFYLNDDLSRRALHVQLVSRISRNIGSLLGLNLDLIEAIALGHDIGHTPFGHAGERYLGELYNKETGRFFSHNVHSVRVLDKVFGRNLTLQTLDGILCHNGEFEMSKYRPVSDLTFDEFDKIVEECYRNGDEAIKKLIPSTLEGCVVRLSDIIAYLGKDRQDAVIAKLLDSNDFKNEDSSGMINAEIINNLTVDLIECSYGKDYLQLSKSAYKQLKEEKDKNYSLIYGNTAIMEKYDKIIKPMFEEVYYELLDDLIKKNKNSVIFKHHIEFVHKKNQYYHFQYEVNEPNQTVVDFIASMTDDYFIELHKFLFPDSEFKVEYQSYFIGM